MRIAPIFTVVLLLWAAAWSAESGNTNVIGTWEGESKCTVPDSPCHDEQAVYHFFADAHDSTKLNLDAYKVVNGTPQLMGTIECHYHSEQATLNCTGNTRQQDTWEFHISGDTMTGTLTVGEKKILYRRISLRKTLSKAP